MDLQGKLFVFLFIGLVSSQQNLNDQYNQIAKQVNDLQGQIDSRLDQLNSELTDDLKRVNLGGNNLQAPFHFGNGAGSNIPDMTDIDQEFDKMTTQLLPLLNDIQEKCYKANRTELGNGLETKFRTSLSCIKNKINMKDLLEEFQTAARTKTIGAFFNRICTFWPDIHGCIKPLISDSKQCLDKEQQHGLDQNINAMDETNSYFCDNNQERINQFMAEGGFQCIQQTQNEIGSCAESTFGKQKQKSATQVSLVYDAESCSNMKELRSCIGTQTAKCSSSTPGQIIDGYVAIIQKTVCNSASSLTWWSTFNVLLVLCTLFYSKMF